MFDQMEGLRATARSIGPGEKLMPRQFSLTGQIKCAASTVKPPFSVR
jgi:hypothetical protein